MCYSGKCLFEFSWSVDCMICNHHKCHEKYRETECMVGGVPYCYETEKYIENNKELLNAIYEQWCKDTPWY